MKVLPVKVDQMGKKKEKKVRRNNNGENVLVKKKKKNGTETLLKKKARTSAKEDAVRKILKKLKRMGSLGEEKPTKKGGEARKKSQKELSKLRKITPKGSLLRKGASKRNLLKKDNRRSMLETDPDDYAEAKRLAQNKTLLAKKRKEIMIKVTPSDGNNEWLEKLDLTCSQNIYLKKMKLFGHCEVRENEFLKLTHENVVEGLKKLQDLHISFNRPYDFLADMVKSDLHMEKVREKIVKDHERVEEREKNKIKRMNKKFNKKSGSAKVASQMEAIEKKKNLQKIDQLRKEDKLKTLNVQEFFLKHSKSDEEKGRRGGNKKSDRKGNKQSDRKGNKQSDRKGNNQSDRKVATKKDDQKVKTKKDRKENIKSNRKGKARFKTKKRIMKNKKNKGRKNFKRR
ncbi:rRNA-processing protein EBP2, putative [Plasmodium knowlesi strain H]|uniref:rRNA-processing protein EBP2, putative n=3 Tax=Plasmodium knowlesi TaxID=5850 RepID=A0A5K1V6V8_PLAKH|nr:rRNA-processing protein EBP2, putative [Plasmodium knowlesi strain H]OTN68182.1 putative rRNA-processing protein EBP2 [Plasmodium knowlesi]CAA9987177.1 rRNA-processing protein EBP2, putative [Plasmodium knowlesi strain H]SBO23936.1 rRNA-processing protein EBP2, putative [Plasmodium knowlesi strain H]SBO25864.1 rRNA-processing protein EBP2, putative [Plasmodium knowlesi strain H]VVS76651.1 rRNA-processing protein EBP2, putative [Plasmodium knowlesi strain H]|eukprot:XP_002261801.1 hypothetical protein, conserved in Plasmodium species [Plasmodium knowlesi strain H]